MSANEPDALLFLVRVWHRTDADGARRFCASVSAAGSRSAQFFDRPDDVARFLDHADRIDSPDPVATEVNPREMP